MVMVRFSRVWRAVFRMGHPQVRWLPQLMTQDGDKTEQFQGDCKGGLSFTTKSGGVWKKTLETMKLPRSSEHSEESYRLTSGLGNDPTIVLASMLTFGYR